MNRNPRSGLPFAEPERAEPPSGRAISPKATFISTPAIGREMRRRLFLLSAAATLRADPHRELYDLFGAMANSLAEGNATPFLQPFDTKMPGYRELAANVRALVDQAEIHSAI